MMRYKEIISEVFHSYDDPDNQLDFAARKPLKKGDTVRVFHGFRDMSDAIRTARIGLSGKDRADRVYSYEYNNNPRGLFVTTSIDVAQKFTSRGAVMEFVAAYDEIEAPVWPGGSYTVQGQMSQSWPGGRAGIIARKQRQKELATEPLSDNIPEIHGSDDNNLARILLASGERQALFVGHLNPDRIVAFYVPPVPYHYKAPWPKLTPSEFLDTIDETPKRDRDKGDYRVFQPNDRFDGATFLRLLLADHPNRDMDEVMRDMADYIFKSRDMRYEFMNYMAPYLWPKQYADALRWLYRTYHMKSRTAS